MKGRPVVPSGVLWLGDIPTSWRTVPLKRALVRNDSGVWGTSFGPDGTPVLRSTEQTVDGRWQIEDPARIHLDEAARNAAHLLEGDLVVTKSSGSPKHIGKTAVVTAEMENRGYSFSNFMQRIRVEDGVSPQFIWYVLNSPVGREQFRFRTTSTTGLGNLSGKIIGLTEVPLPPEDEQLEIVRFLDAWNRQATRLVSAKQRLIALLNEQKMAIIQQAVTCGLNSDVPRVSSGQDWLGDVPAHWDTIPLKYLTDFKNGFAFKPSDWGDTGTPIIRIQNLRGSREFNYTLRRDIPEDLVVEQGDLLFAWSGNRGTSFGPYVWDKDFHGFLNQHIFKLVDHKPHTRYFYFLLEAVTRHIEEQTHGIIGLVHINRGELGAIKVPIPPREEQIIISEALDEQTAAIDRAICNEERGVEFVREYRTRLIADVVTGKLDVRDVEVPEVEHETLVSLGAAGVDDLELEEEVLVHADD